MDGAFAIYLISVNIFGFSLFASDKKRAQSGRGRIPEALLMFAALIGGCAGALAAMVFCHHKTRKPKFYIGVPLITAAYAVLAYLILKI